MELPEVSNTPPQVVPRFEWMVYRNRQEICYVSDFLKAHRGQPSSFYQALDLANPNHDAVPTTKKYGTLSEITDVMYKKIVMHGQLESLGKIARKTGAASREEDEKDYNYYDQNDSWIDDEGDVPVVKNKAQMQLVCAEYGDFNGFEGGLTDFVKSDVYRHRLQLLQEVGREPQPESPKKVEPVPTVIEVEKRPREQSLNKGAADKIKKKQKKSTATDKDKEKEKEKDKEKVPVVQSKPTEHRTAEKEPPVTHSTINQRAEPMMEYNRMIGGVYPQQFHLSPQQYFPSMHPMNPQIMFYSHIPRGIPGITPNMASSISQGMSFLPQPAQSQSTPQLPKKDSMIIEIDE